MLPLTVGFLIAGPVSGWLSDHFGARPFATGGMIVAAGSFVLLALLPVDFHYGAFAAILLLNGIGMGLFASPNRAGIMNSLPSDQRGVGGGMSTTFQNSAMVLSIGVFFSLMILGLASTLPHTLSSGLVAQGVRAADADRLAALPPVSVLFASLLGYNPVETLLGPHVLAHLPAGHAAYLTGRGFFPTLISGPFAKGLTTAFAFAIGACLIAAVASWLRGGKYVHTDQPIAVGGTDSAPAPPTPGTTRGGVAPERATVPVRADGLIPRVTRSAPPAVGLGTARARPRDDEPRLTEDAPHDVYTLIVTAHGYRPARYAMTTSGNGRPAGADATPRTNGRITGVVCGPGPDSPVPGAVLRAVDPRGTIVAYATTGHDGRFELPGLLHELSTATRAEAPPDQPDPHGRPGATLHLTLDGTWS